MSERASFRLVLFTAAMLSLAVLALGYTLILRPAPLSSLLVALVILAMLSEVLCVQFASVSVSVAASLAAMASILMGPAAGGIVAASSTIPASLTVKERPILRGSFNLAQLALSGLAGGWAYVLAGGRQLVARPLAPDEIPAVILPLCCLAAGELLVNTSLVGSFVSLRSEAPFSRVWKSLPSWGLPTSAALAVVAVVMAQVVAFQGLLGLVLFLVPLAIAQQFHERYARLRDAYAGMVRSLVAVIDAKDPYTRGHSERVAAYSVAIAKHLRFSPQRVERVELAALLHDLGKVGVSRAILRKEGPLTDGEFEAIKAHPAIGARIIEGVPALADLVPYVCAHHERMDGSGYGERMRGDEIPLEARILSVADAFDAMTSSRPYRSALSREESIAELRMCSGRQFDAVLVEAFVEVLQGLDLEPGTRVAEAADEAV